MSSEQYILKNAHIDHQSRDSADEVQAGFEPKSESISELKNWAGFEPK